MQADAGHACLVDSLAYLSLQGVLCCAWIEVMEGIASHVDRSFQAKPFECRSDPFPQAQSSLSANHAFRQAPHLLLGAWPSCIARCLY
jgi:hypothetical protein